LQSHAVMMFNLVLCGYVCSHML